MAQLHTLWLRTFDGTEVLVDHLGGAHTPPWTPVSGMIATRRSDQEVARQVTSPTAQWRRNDGRTTALPQVGVHSTIGPSGAFDAAGNLWSSISSNGGTIGRWDGTSWTTWTGVGIASGTMAVFPERSTGSTPVLYGFGQGTSVNSPVRMFDPATGVGTDFWRAADLPLNAIPGWYQITAGHLRSAVSLPDHSGWLVSMDQCSGRVTMGGSIVAAPSARGIVHIDNAANFVAFHTYHSTGGPSYKILLDGLGGIWVTNADGAVHLIAPDGSILATPTIPSGAWLFVQACGGPALAPAPTGFTLGLHFGPRRGGFH